MTTRKSLRLAAVALAGTSMALLTACGSGDSSSDAATKSVATIRGEVAVPEAPERVVVLDGQSADVVFSLGVDPVAWDGGTYASLDDTPWLKDVNQDTYQPKLVGEDMSVDYEAVLATEPDLIIVDTFVATEGEVFDRLNEIAPTITSDVDRAQSWEERTTFLADALGEQDKGKEVIEETNTFVSDQAVGLEALNDKTYYYVAYSIDQGGLWYGNGTWFEGYGLKPAPNQDNTHSNFQVTSLERISDYNSDVLGIWAMTEADKADLMANAQFNELPAVKAGRVIWLDMPMAVATNTPGPMSIKYALSQVTPVLKGSVD